MFLVVSIFIVANPVTELKHSSEEITGFVVGCSKTISDSMPLLTQLEALRVCACISDAQRESGAVDKFTMTEKQVLYCIGTKNDSRANLAPSHFSKNKLSSAGITASMLLCTSENQNYPLCNCMADQLRLYWRRVGRNNANVNEFVPIGRQACSHLVKKPVEETL